MICPFNHKSPQLHPSVFVAPGAHLIGDVKIGAGSSVWFGAVLRGDIQAIRIGRNTNVQDNCVIHVDMDKPCVLKNGIIMGHQATAHACVVEDGVLIGMGARILSGARIGACSLIAAGAVVLEGMKVPERSLVVGVPGKVIRRLTDAEIKKHRLWALGYLKVAAEFKKYLG
jgi:carbonic anhydrase/acetyltransferase-like protein (isoleucine patch superfamily)